MAWIESHQNLERHPKTMDLMNFMGWDLDQTIGKLHRLWWWCLEYAEDGDLRKHGKGRIANSMGVKNEDSEKLMEALISAGWVDVEPYLRIHGWWDYIGLFLQRRYGEKNKNKWSIVRSLYNDCTETAQQLYNDCTETAQQLSQPNLTIPNLTIPKEDIGNPKSKELIELWNLYAEKSAGLKKSKELSKIRIKKCLDRLKQRTLEEWEKVFEICSKTAFLNGQNDRGWKASFDWIINNEDNSIKVLEGKYEKSELISNGPVKEAGFAAPKPGKYLEEHETAKKEALKRREEAIKMFAERDRIAKEEEAAKFQGGTNAENIINERPFDPIEG